MALPEDGANEGAEAGERDHHDKAAPGHNDASQQFIKTLNTGY
jgi:hypothetical protein